MSSAVLQDLLRSPARAAERASDDQGLQTVVKVALFATVVGSAVFGAVLGSHRGGIQIAYSAIKMPLVVLSALALSVPAIYALSAAVHRVISLRKVSALVLAAAARSSLVLMAASPVIWLLIDVGMSYHACIFVASVAYLVSAMSAVRVVLSGLRGGVSRFIATGLTALVFLGAAGQTAWSLRPYLGRPSQAEVPFLRGRDGTFADAVYRSTRSMMGIYDVVEREVVQSSGRSAGNRRHLLGGPEHYVASTLTAEDMERFEAERAGDRNRYAIEGPTQVEEAAAALAEAQNAAREAQAAAADAAEAAPEVGDAHRADEHPVLTSRQQAELEELDRILAETRSLTFSQRDRRNELLELKHNAWEPQPGEIAALIEAGIRAAAEDDCVDCERGQP